MSDTRVRPRVDVGDVVLWYTDGDYYTEPFVGLVTRVGDLTLCLNLVTPDERMTRPIEGAWYIEDPRARGEHTRASGGWDYSPLLKRIMALEKIL